MGVLLVIASKLALYIIGCRAKSCRLGVYGVGFIIGFGILAFLAFTLVHPVLLDPFQVSLLSVAMVSRLGIKRPGFFIGVEVEVAVADEFKTLINQRSWCR